MRDSIRLAKATGIFFLISDATAIAALVFYQGILKNSNFIADTSANTAPVLIGAFLEILLAISVAGTAITLYPILKEKSESLTLGYVIGRALEATIILVGVIALLSIVTMHQQFPTYSANLDTQQSIAKALTAVHDWTFLFGPNIILSVNATMLGLVLYKSKLVPRKIALLALIDGPLLFVSGIAILFGVYSQTSTLAAILALPMFVFEVSFALWLLLKGLRK